LLGIPKSRLSRRIAELETRLNASLLQRTTRKLSLTAVGERYLQHCQAMLLAGRVISTPRDLASLPVLGAIEADRMVHYDLVHSSGERCEVAIEARLAIDDFPIRKNAALSGLGLTMLPMMNCREELADGRLIQLLPDWSLPGGHLQAAYTQRRGMLPAVRAWIDHISSAFTHDLHGHE